MPNYQQELLKQLSEIDRLIKISESNLAKEKTLPDAHVRVTYSHGYPQLNYRKDGSAKGHYLKKSDHQKAVVLLQRKYEEKLAKELHANKNRLEKFLKNYDPSFIEKAYEDFGDFKKKLIAPIRPSDEEFVRSWTEEHPAGQNPYPEKPKYQSAQGTPIRTKSEKIIADLLESYNVPYRYEPKLVLKGGIVKYPDFAILNLRERKTVYWEHLGLVSDEEYASANFKKLALYETNGIILGERLIITFETEKAPLNIALLKRKIEIHIL
ncbi:MAG: hypothetical protein K6G10_11235 [Butyrivibrio sp.]|nr:hypothetical protein [Butyrivibrio sp.]